MTRAAIAAVLVAMLASCGPDNDNRAPRPQKFADQRGVEPVLPLPPEPAAPLPPPTPPLTVASAPTTCLAPGALATLGFHRGELRVCADDNADGTADQCAVWTRATGKLVHVEARYAVESEPSGSDDAVPAAPAVAETSLAPDDVAPPATDARVTIDGANVEICPQDRTCAKLVPLVNDGEEIVAAVADAAHRNAALLTHNTDGHTARLELWDLEHGRMRARIPFRDLDRDTAYDFSLRVVGDSVVAIAKHTDNAFAAATIYGFDGTRRGALGAGSRYLSADFVDLGDGSVAVLDLGATGKPYTVELERVATATITMQLTIPLDTEDVDDILTMRRLADGEVAILQWHSKLRVFLLDPRTHTSHAYTVPTCP